MDAPFNIQNHRREQCERCKTPCQYQNDSEYRRIAENACPIRKWMEYATFVKSKWKGAGDAFASLADPVAGAIDKVFKTKVRGCSACAKRKEMLNHLIPFGQK